MKKIKLEEAYFGVSTLTFNGKELRYWNLFENLRVKWSVARYVAMSKKEREQIWVSPIHFCFGDVWRRCEYEWIVNRWPCDENDKVCEGKKVDVFDVYVLPNEKHLMEIVNSITKSSAKKYLKEERKRLRR